MSLPDQPSVNHIKPQWIAVTARLQQAAGTQQGAAILTVTIVVDQNGLPSFWNEPKVTRLEPRSRAEMIAALLSSP